MGKGPGAASAARRAARWADDHHFYFLLAVAAAAALMAAFMSARAGMLLHELGGAEAQAPQARPESPPEMRWEF